MKKTACVAFAVLSLGYFASAVAEDKIPVPSEYEGIAESIPPKKIDWEERTKFGSKGNVTVYVDKNGTPTEVYVVGVAPVSTTLAAVEAEEEAREEAEFNAKAAFALWMSEKFAVSNVRDKKVLIVRKNGQEQSESVSISKRHAEQMASAAWRGMSVFWHKRSNGRYISVWRWSVSEQKLAKMVEILTRDGDPASLKRKTDMDVKDIDGTFR